MSSPYIAARGLGKSFNGKPVLADVSFTVEPGDVVGVLGKNGAGKTTLLELVLGFTPATAGGVQLFGYDSYRLPGRGEGAHRLRAAARRARESADGCRSDRRHRFVLSAAGTTSSSVG